MKGKTLLWLAIAGAVGYGLVQVFGLGKWLKDSATGAYTGAVDKTADVLTRLFGPELSQAAQESLYYTVTFDDTGARHAVPSSTVNAQGLFRFTNPPNVERLYALYRDKSGVKHARPVPQP